MQPSAGAPHPSRPPGCRSPAAESCCCLVSLIAEIGRNIGGVPANPMKECTNGVGHSGVIGYALSWGSPAGRRPPAAGRGGAHSCLTHRGRGKKREVQPDVKFAPAAGNRRTRIRASARTVPRHERGPSPQGGPGMLPGPREI